MDLIALVDKRNFLLSPVKGLINHFLCKLILNFLFVAFKENGRLLPVVVRLPVKSQTRAITYLIKNQLNLTLNISKIK